MIDSDIQIEFVDPELARATTRQSDSNDERLDKLELKVKTLSVINESLYELLVAKLKLTEPELTAMIEQVVANRITRLEAKSTCRSCSRLVPANRKKCMYCGGALLDDVAVSPFDL
jgi:hypothetical protein